MPGFALGSCRAACWSRLHTHREVSDAMALQTSGRLPPTLVSLMSLQEESCNQRHHGCLSAMSRGWVECMGTALTVNLAWSGCSIEVAASPRSCCQTDSCHVIEGNLVSSINNSGSAARAHSQHLNTSQPCPGRWQVAIYVVVVAQVPARPNKGVGQTLVFTRQLAGQLQNGSTHSISKLVSELHDSGREP